ncbi:MAG TPA: alpha/beta hydrolase [Clostridia bacterium]|nr:alpha/beta hydrolase [Clostridia bacterium]
MLKSIVFMILLIICIISLVTLSIRKGYSNFFKEKSHGFVLKESKNLKIFIISGLSVIALIIFSQANVKTPEIKGDLGISELIKVEVNDSDQWISIRGKNKNNPVILFLAGGPGGSQLGAVRRNLKNLENNFTIVNWEQPGSGKSFNSLDTEALDIEKYVNDGLVITDIIKEKLGKEKIYIIGESWGSALGVFLVNKNPDDYYAFIGTGQMVAFEETEKICYKTALDLAKSKGDQEQVDKLEEIGQPPHYGENMALTTATYLQYLSKEMAENPDISNPGYSTLEDLASPEYGILDQVNFFRGMLSTFSKVYPQLYPIDLRNDFSDLEVPVYMIHGKYDLNAPISLVKDYYNQLEAPEKKLIIFEHSGHSPWINEKELFCQKTMEIFVHHKK